MAAAAALVLALGHASSTRGSAHGGDEPRAPARLSETGLYVPGRFGLVDARNRPFSPQYPLWSDGAAKRRWVSLPPGVTIDARDDARWVVPVGTRFWKEFSFKGRRIETRLIERATADRWVFASYLWNDEQTEATLASPLGEPGVLEIAAGRRHSIPSTADCLACHNAARPGPLGFNPLQLSDDRDPHAIHGEPLVEGMVTLKTLVEEGRLSPPRADLVASPPRIATSDPRTRTALGYLAANCGGCHNGTTEIAVDAPSLHAADVLRDGDGLARRLVGHRTTWQVPGVPEGTSALVDPAAPGQSAILVRMRSRSPSTQMPPLGTVLRDAAALDVIDAWIGELARSH